MRQCDELRWEAGLLRHRVGWGAYHLAGLSAALCDSIAFEIGYAHGLRTALADSTHTTENVARQVSSIIPRPWSVRSMGAEPARRSRRPDRPTTTAQRRGARSEIGADVAASLSGAIGAMSGPLHGGAPARVLPMIQEVEHTGDAARLVTRLLDRGERAAARANSIT